MNLTRLDVQNGLNFTACSLEKRRKQNGFLRNRKNEWKQFFQKKTQEKQWHFSILPQMVWQMYENQMITFLK